MAREVPESSSNLYSVSGPSAHSLMLDLPVSLAADIVAKNHADTESRCFVMNRCYVLGDALDGRQRTRSDALIVGHTSDTSERSEFALSPSTRHSHELLFINHGEPIRSIWERPLLSLN
jgi:hypothetical protein